MANAKSVFNYVALGGKAKNAQIHATANSNNTMFGYAKTTMKSEFLNDIPIIHNYAASSKRDLYIVGGCHGKGHRVGCLAKNMTETVGAATCNCYAGYPGKTDDSHFSVYKREITFSGVSFKYVDLSGVGNSINIGEPDADSIKLYDEKILPRLKPYAEQAQNGKAIMVFSYCYTWWFMKHLYD